MKRSIAVLALAVGVLLLWPVTEAHAQTQIGPRIGFDVGGDIKEFFLGGDARFDLGPGPWKLQATFDLFFPEDPLDLFAIGVNVLYELKPLPSNVKPYVGVGLALNRLEVGKRSNTETGLNLIGGATFRSGNLRPFAQVQAGIGDLDLLTISGGLLFDIG